MKTTISRNIYQRTPIAQILYSKPKMEENIYKLNACAGKLGLTPTRYKYYLKQICESPIIYPHDKTERVTETMHTVVFDYITKKNKPVDEVNEEKDFKKVATQISEALKKDYSISKKHNNSAFFTKSKIHEWETIVNEVNNYFTKTHWIDKNLQQEFFYFGMYKFGQFEFNPAHKIPILKFKLHVKYGRELYIEFPIFQEKNENGVVVKSLNKRYRVTADLNSIADADTLYEYAEKLILSIYFKIKAGYNIKYEQTKYSTKLNEIEHLPATSLQFIPTLYAYLEHFKSVNSLNDNLYSTIRSDVNTLTKFTYGLPRKLNFELNKIDHTLKFTRFNRVLAIKFKEYLQSNTETSTGIPICSTTIGNIFSSIGNLINRIMEQRVDLEKDGYVNPFLNHKIKRSLPNIHITYNNSQLINLSEKLKNKNENQLLFFIEFLYHTSIRPIEARRLRIHHLKNLSKGLFLPGNITKNGKSRTIPINKFILRKLNEQIVLDTPANYFLFSSNNGGIGQNETGKNYFSRKYKKVRDASSDLSALHTLYSFRHTFAKIYMQKALNDNKYEARIVKLGGILGHSNPDMTEKYLRTLGEDFSHENPNEGIDHWEKEENV